MRKEVNIAKYFKSEKFQELYNYDGSLGAVYSKEKTTFIIWAPTAEAVSVIFYGKESYNTELEPLVNRMMSKSINGTWILEVDEDLNGEYYNYLVNIDGKEDEVVDPYAKAVGVNGKKSMVVDLEKTNPENWDKDKKQIGRAHV